MDLSKKIFNEVTGRLLLLFLKIAIDFALLAKIKLFINKQYDKSSPNF